MKEWINKLTIWGKIGLFTAIASCLIGVSILLIYAITRYENLPILGFWFLYLALLSNIFVATWVVCSILCNPKSAKKELIVLGIMLLNIPIGLVCALLGIELL